jgi:hypothetical protein
MAEAVDDSSKFCVQRKPHNVPFRSTLDVILSFYSCYMARYHTFLTETSTNKFFGFFITMAAESLDFSLALFSSPIASKDVK